LEQLLAKSKIKNKLDELTIELFSPLAHKLGWNKRENENHTDALLRSLAIGRAGRAKIGPKNKKIIAEAKEIFIKIQKEQNVNPDIRGVVYSIIATHGGMKEYDILVKMYQQETLHEEKNRIGGALGDFKNPKILKLTCEFAMSADVRIQDTVGILSSVGANPTGRDIWWSFIIKNWKILVSRYGQGGLTLGRAVKAIGGSAEEKHLKSFRKFFDTHPAPGAKRAIDQVTERLEGNIAWLKRDGRKIEEFLKN
jgi:aminopeptidase N